jgi:hypothetical protein
MEIMKRLQEFRPGDSGTTHDDAEWEWTKLEVRAKLVDAFEDIHQIHKAERCLFDRDHPLLWENAGDLQITL